MGGCIQSHVDIYLTEECMATVQSTFPYLVDKRFVTGGGDVGALRWHIIDSRTPFRVGPRQVLVTPLRVEHGFAQGGHAPFECLGFRIDTLSYISDCVRSPANQQHYIPPETLELMRCSEVVILDGLKMSRHASHYSIPQAITTLLELSQEQVNGGKKAPSLAFLTDLTHRVEHHAMEAQVQKLLGGMRAWLHQQSQPAQYRWWTQIWDDERNEATETLALRDDYGSANAHPLVPPIHVAWDGLRVDFHKVLPRNST